MTPPAAGVRRRSGAARGLRWLLVAAVLLVLAVVLWNKGKELIGGKNTGAGAYLVIIALVFGDAVFPILPGETTLNAGSVLASAGKLELWLVIVSGAIGAVAGDSTVYWLARKATGRVRGWMERAAGGSTGTKVIDLVRRRGPVFLLFGRYIPGVRFALNATLGGVIRMPYPTFLFWSSISGTLWSIVTCAGAYLVGSALAGYPVLSLVVTCVASTALITAGIWAQGRWSARRARTRAAVSGDSGNSA
jgi:membrane protein DedA with SNARE-associated domain